MLWSNVYTLDLQDTVKVPVDGEMVLKRKLTISL